MEFRSEFVKVSDECNCQTCQMIREGVPVEEIERRGLEWEKEMIARHGWCMRGGATDKVATGYRAKTVGLPEEWDHPNLQIVLPLFSKSLRTILTPFVEMIRSGRVVRPGKRFGAIADSGDVIAKLAVVAARAMHDDEEVVRLILSNNDGEIVRDPMDLWGQQWDGVIEQGDQEVAKEAGA